MKFSDCVQQIWVMQNSPEAIGWTLKEDWLAPIRCIWLKYHLILISRLIILDFTFISINVVDANYVANQLLLVMQCSTDNVYRCRECSHIAVLKILCLAPDCFLPNSSRKLLLSLCYLATSGIMPGLSGGKINFWKRLKISWKDKPKIWRTVNAVISLHCRLGIV